MGGRNPIRTENGLTAFVPRTTAGDMAKGEYRATYGDRRSIVTTCCPGCGGDFKFPRHYQVGTGGLVNPLLRCPLFGCGWTGSAILVGWRSS